jgi:magnesium chelatase family protein
MLATVPSATLLGVDGCPITVEVHVSTGLPGFTIVGLPDASCREARDRVRAALLSSGLPWEIKRVTVNLAPSGMRKSGAGLDLPIAVALLVAAGVLRAPDVEGVAFIGELGLDGSIRLVPGIMAMVDAVRQPRVVVPVAAVNEASVLGRHDVRSAATLRELTDALRGRRSWPEPPPPAPPAPALPEPDLADVRGQALGRFAVEVAAAGGHHLLLTGPPGAGKTMLARRLPALLPPLSVSEALATTRIHSAAGLVLPPAGVLQRPPFRAPHHGASAVSLVGGGTASMRPGEISCANFGVLFLDELAEFPSAVLDTLRQPLEEGAIRVCRARASVTFPARFLLVAAMNPCPCGEGLTPGACRCREAARLRYANRISGPLLDRFDLRVLVQRPEISELLPNQSAPAVGFESSQTVAARVAAARQMAAERGLRCNADLPASLFDELAPLAPAARAVLEARLRQGRLSARGLHRIRRVARTLADLAGRTDLVEEEDVCAALLLRDDAFPAPAGSAAS